MKLNAWSDLLALHPDKAFVAYILDGIHQGFRIGFQYSRHSCRAAKRNMRSVAEVPQVVSEYPDTERRLGRVVLLEDASAQSVQTSPFGVIPKRGKPDNWRIVACRQQRQ